MQLREAKESDREQIATVLRNGYNLTLEEAKNAFKEELQKSIHYLVAVKEEKILGLVSWISHGVAKHGLAELVRITVLPEARGQGIAGKLFRELENETQKYFGSCRHKLRKLFLFVHANNLPAYNFYKKMGMYHEATLRDHFYKGEDEFVMAKFYD